MTLYHWTSRSIVESILSEGFLDVTYREPGGAYLSDDPKGHPGGLNDALVAVELPDDLDLAQWRTRSSRYGINDYIVPAAVLNDLGIFCTTRA